MKKKRRTGVIPRNLHNARRPRLIFAVVRPDGRLFEVIDALDLGHAWRRFLLWERNTREEMESAGWRIRPAMIEWEDEE